MFGYTIDLVLAMACGFLLYKLWDRGQSNKTLDAFQDYDWLAEPIDKRQKQEELSAQEIYDFSGQYLTVLKGAFASPTPAKFQQLSETLSAPHNLHDQLWRDMAVRLSATYDSYKIEYVALIDFLAKNAEDPVQLYAGLRLAIGFPEASSKLKRLAKKIQNSSKVKPALLAAAKLR